MKKIKFDIAFIIAIVIGLGPWLIFDNPSPWWYLPSVTAGVFVAILGMGAQMEQLGQGNTGEELLESIWNWIKEKCKRKK